MLLETNLSYKIAKYQEDCHVSGKLLFERALYSRKCVVKPSCVFQLKEYSSVSPELCESALWLDDALSPKELLSRYHITGLILESSGKYTIDYLNVVSLEEIKHLLMLIYQLPNNAIEDIFAFHTYRHQFNSVS